MQVTIDPSAGFCWGVVRTIEIAEFYLRQDPGNVYVLGDIIHNPAEIERLQKLGLKTITHSELPKLKGTGAKVLIRAHGEPPSTYRIAYECGIELIDATCPIVTKLQERVRKYYNLGYQIVLYGKKNHPEVRGVCGVCNDECVVVLSVDEALQLVDRTRKTALFTQTTMDRATFHQIEQALREALTAEFVVDPDGDGQPGFSFFEAKDTICGQVAGRESKLAQFAQAQDVVIFVAGRNSSNGKVLYATAKAANPRTYFISDVDELRPEWLVGAERVGISGATSTPHWLMAKVKEYIEKNFASEPATVEHNNTEHHSFHSS